MALSSSILDEIKKDIETKKGGASTASSPKSASTQGTSAETSSNLSSGMLDRIHKDVALKRLGREDTGVDEDFIKSFDTAYQTFLYKTQYDWKNLNYQNSRDASYAKQREEMEKDLAERARAIRTHLDINRHNLDDEAYKSISEHLDQFDISRAGIMHDFSTAKAYYSQWATEEEYDKYVAQEEERKAMANFDLDSGEKEIASLENMLQTYKTLTRVMTDEKGELIAEQIRQKYGGEEEIKDLISQKKKYLNQARNLQKGITLSGVAENADFKDSSGYKTTIKENPSWWETGVGDTQYEWINNQNGFRDEYESSMADLNAKTGASSQSGVYVGPKESEYYQKGYDKLNSSEIAIYNYYHAKEGKEKAQEYLDSIQEGLNLRKATAMFEGMDDKTFQEMIFGVEAGLDQFQSGMAALINTEDDYIPQSAVQMASAMVREDLADDGVKLPDWMGGASLGQVGYDAITTTANMAPSILTSMAVGMLNPVAGQVAGSLLMGGAAAGNAYQEALNEGYDKDQARGYGLLVGASEIVMEKVIGGISALGGNTLGKFFTKNLSNADTALKMIAKKLGGSALSEFGEEYLQEVLTPVFKNIALRTDEEVKILSAEALYSGILGALTAGVMEGPTTIAGEVTTHNTGKQLQEAGISAKRLADIGSTFAADTVAYQLAGKVDENTGAYTMGRLFNEIGATLTEQNVNDITEALVTKGMPRGIAEEKAKTMAKIVDGATMTDKFIDAMEDDTFLAEAMRTTIIDHNATWFQRTKGYNEALMALAQEKAAPKASRTEEALPGQENAHVSDKVDTKNENGTETGSEASIPEPKAKKISAIKDGQVTIKMEDGSEVNAAEAGIDPNDGVQIATIAQIDGISVDDANNVLGVLKADPGVNPQWGALGAKEVYRYGFYGMSYDQISKHGVFANSLTESQRKAIYDTGMNARKMQVANKNATVVNKNATVVNKNATTEKSSATGKRTGIYFDAGGGNVVDFHAGYKKKLNERQSAGVNAARVLRDLGIGGDIYFFESYRNANGKRVYLDKNGVEKKAPHGWYEKDGSIHIDLNAGNGGEGVVLFTMAHELTHFIQQWSDQKYKVLADFLIKEYEKGMSVDGLVRAKQKYLSKLRGKEISYDEAYHEVIADSMQSMLADGNVLDKLNKLKQTDKGLVAKMKQFIDQLAAKIRRAYKSALPYTDEGKMVLAMGKAVEQLQQIFAEALVEASENYQSAMENVVEADAESVSADEILTDGAVVTDGEGTKYSIRSMKHDIAEGQMFEDLKKYCGWSQRRVNELKKNLSDLVEYMTPYRDILDMNESYDREGRRFSPYKPNSDPLYKISMDFSTLCSKRLLTQYVIENLQLRENRPMSPEEQMAIRDMLNEYRNVEKGLQVACAMCYVEAARLKSPKQISKWMADPETQMRNYFADKNPEFAAFIKEKQSDFKESRGYARNAKKKDMSAKDVRELNKIRPRLRSQYQVSAEEQAIIERAKVLPNSTYLTAANLANLSETDPTIYSAYTAFVRTATRSKSLETDEPYYYGDSRRDNGNGIVVTDDFIDAVNRENGMRFSSWSDWRIQHMLDYITAVIDNSVRGAAMHGYTKFGEEVRVLGKTGMMFNMSGVAGTQTGLNEDGSLSFSPTESMDVDEAIQLREEFPEHAGLQCIGVGDDHIVALLRSDIIDYVIPYHTSGLNAALRRMANIYGWKDYTTTQHAAIDKSMKLEDAVDKEHWHEEPVYSEFFVGYDTGMTGIDAMRASADRYKQMCAERGLKPKFEQFANEDNYWKLLIDRKMINQKTGKLIKQKAVTPTFDFDTIKEVVDRYVQNYDSGLEARALNHIVENWDSIPKRIRDLKKQGGTKAKKTSKTVDTLANQTLAAQPTEDGIKQSSREEAKTFKNSQNARGEFITDVLIDLADSNSEWWTGKYNRAILGMSKTNDTEFRQFYQEILKRTMDLDEYEVSANPTIEDSFIVQDEKGREYIYRVALDGYLHGVVMGKVDVAKFNRAMKRYERGRPHGRSYADISRRIENARNEVERHSAGDSRNLASDGNSGHGGLGSETSQSDKTGNGRRGEPIDQEVPTVTMDDSGTELKLSDRDLPSMESYNGEAPTVRELWDDIAKVSLRISYVESDLRKAERNGYIEDINRIRGRLADVQEKYIEYADYLLKNCENYSDKEIIHLGKALRLYEGFSAAKTYTVEQFKRDLSAKVHEYRKNTAKVMREEAKSMPREDRMLQMALKFMAYQAGYDISDFSSDSEGTNLDHEDDWLLDSDIPFSDRDTESVSNRSLLANAFEGVAQNDIERNKVQEYKDKIDLINAEEKKLQDLNQKIKDMSFTKGPKDTKAIRDLQFEANQTANRINTYDRQLLRLEASKPLQNVLDREKKMAYQRAEKKGKEALEAYRERATKTQRELMDRFEQSRKRAKESREKTAMRHKIQNVVKELNDLLLNESKKHHVPDNLKKAVADALALVNMDTVGAEERIAKLEADLMKAKTPKAIQEISRKIDNIREMGEKMDQRLKDLRDAYEEIQESDDPDIANAYDPVIAGCLKELAGSIGNTPLRDMSIEQLSDVYDMYRMVLIRVRDANKTFVNDKKESISNLASRVIGEVRRVGGEHKYRASILDPVKKFGWNNLKPVYAFEHIGSDTLTEVFNGVRAGEDVWAKDVTEAREYYLDKSRKYGYDKWDFKKKYRFESTSGDVFELTLDQILSLYAYSKREQAYDHLRLGGFVFDSNIETYKEKDGKSGKSILKYKVNTADAYQITPEILAGIIGKLSKEQTDFVDEMQAYLSTTMGAKGNEITMKMYGVKLFKEKFYFPLKSAKQFMFEQNEVSGEVRIKNSGFTNKVTPKANNPVILSNFMDVWSNHVNDMSMYHAFVLPLEDFNRIFNYNSPKQEGQPPVSVKGTIQNAYDPAAVSYVKQLITDLNGGARTDSTTGPINKLMGMFKKGAVFASASVVIQQPSAIARAAAIIDTKYFIGPKVDHKRHKALWDEVKKYAPVAIIKEMGYFDTNMGKSTQDFILAKEYSGIKEKAAALVKDSGYRDEVLSKAPALADEIAWCAIWEAAKREMHDKHPGLDVKSEPFLMLAGARFTEVITKTQVYDSVLSRSANMRSKDTGMKMATAFMAEPTTSINMVADALLKAKRGDKKTCRKAIGSVVASAILNSFLVSWVYAARDDDEDETYWEKYLASIVGSIVDGVNPATYIPFIKDIVSIVKGYDVERSDMAVISDLWKASQELKKDDVSAWRKVEGFVGSICQIFGLPVKNIMRDARSVFQVYDTVVNGEKSTVRGTAYAIAGGLTGATYSNPEQLYSARKAGDEEHAARVEGRYDDEKSANAAVRQAIKDRYLEDDLSFAEATKHLMQYAGMEADDAYWLMDAWKHRKDTGADDDYNKYNDLYEAVRTGKNLKAVIKEYTDNGVKAKTLSSQITEHFKPKYVEMSTSEKAGIKGYLLNAFEQCGISRDDAAEKLRDWDFEAKHGFAYSDRKDAYQNGMVSEGELVKILEERGYSPEDAAAQVTAYEWDAEGVEGATADAIQDYTEWCEPVGIPKSTYMAFRRFDNSTENDVDENGKKIAYSAVQKIMAYINDLNLTPEQKDALAKSTGWSDKTIIKYKLW